MLWLNSRPSDCRTCFSKFVADFLKISFYARRNIEITHKFHIARRSMDSANVLSCLELSRSVQCSGRFRAERQTFGFQNIPSRPLTGQPPENQSGRQSVVSVWFPFRTRWKKCTLKSVVWGEFPKSRSFCKSKGKSSCVQNEERISLLISPYFGNSTVMQTKQIRE